MTNNRKEGLINEALAALYFIAAGVLMIGGSEWFAALCMFKALVDTIEAIQWQWKAHKEGRANDSKAEA